MTADDVRDPDEVSKQYLVLIFARSAGCVSKGKEKPVVVLL